MIHDDTLYERMRDFFDRIHDYEITEHEAIELAWVQRDAGEACRAQHVPDLDHAARMAVALGPDYDILILVRKLTETGVQDNNTFPLLAAWLNRERRPGDDYPPPGLTSGCLSRSSGGHYRSFTQHFSNGNGTCEAIMFASASRPYKPVSYRRTRPSVPLTLGNRRGAKG